MTHLYTIGHSTKTIDDFIKLLDKHGIGALVDVRRWPSSRRYPHFNRTSLEENLPKHEIKYEWLGEELGGFRKENATGVSLNMAWQNESFRNYADYTMTAPFKDGIRRLLDLASDSSLSIMCAEQMYWRCHRRIISDYLKVEGHSIIHIIGAEKTEEHQLPSFAKIVDGELRYPEN